MTYWGSDFPVKTHHRDEAKPLIAFKKLDLDLLGKPTFRSPSYNTIWTDLECAARDITASGSGPGIYTIKNRKDMSTLYLGGNCWVKVGVFGTVHEFSGSSVNYWDAGRKAGYKAEFAKILSIVSFEADDDEFGWDDDAMWYRVRSGELTPPKIAKKDLSVFGELPKGLLVESGVKLLKAVTVAEANAKLAARWKDYIQNEMIRPLIAYHDRLTFGSEEATVALFLQNELDIDPDPMRCQNAYRYYGRHSTGTKEKKVMFDTLVKLLKKELREREAKRAKRRAKKK